MYHNIESRRYFGRPYYVAYGPQSLWHVQKQARDFWVARMVKNYGLTLPARVYLQGATMRAISEQLASMGN